MDPHVENVAARAVAGEHIPPEELLPLFAFETQSAEAAHIRWAARVIGGRASHGVGQIYAQIGIDALPCPIDCAFCAFAKSLGMDVRHEDHVANGDVYSVNFDDAVITAVPPAEDCDAPVLPLQRICELARIFDEAGVHLVSLMCTAALPHEILLAAVQAVRAVVRDDMKLLVNAGDMSLEFAKQLKAAGADMAYHANRIGEGEITRAKPEARLATMRNIKESGMQLMNAVEPVCEDTSPELVLQRMVESASFAPYCSGVGTLTKVEGARMGGAVGISRGRAAFYAAIFRLLVGEGIPFGTGSGNVVWVDAGTNPRGRDLPPDAKALMRNVNEKRKELEGREWIVPKR